MLTISDIMAGRVPEAPAWAAEKESDPPRIARLRKIGREFQAAKVDGRRVDVITAGVLVQVYDRCNEANKAKLVALPLGRAVAACWAVSRGGAS